MWIAMNFIDFNRLEFISIFNTVFILSFGSIFFCFSHIRESRFNQKNGWKIVKTAIRQNALVFSEIHSNSKKIGMFVLHTVPSNYIKWTYNKNPIKILHLTIAIHLIPLWQHYKSTCQTKIACIEFIDDSMSSLP